jgi:hypothetical protein
LPPASLTDGSIHVLYGDRARRSRKNARQFGRINRGREDYNSAVLVDDELQSIAGLKV